MCNFELFCNSQVNSKNAPDDRRFLLPSYRFGGKLKVALLFSIQQNEYSLHLEAALVTRNIWVCRVTQTVVWHFSFHLSRFGFLGLAGDRYLAIVHPLKYRDWGKTKNGWVVVLLLLIITAIIDIPSAMYTQVAKTSKNCTPFSLNFMGKICNYVLKSWWAMFLPNGNFDQPFFLPFCRSSFFGSKIAWKTTVNLFDNNIVTNRYCLEDFNR